MIAFFATCFVAVVGALLMEKPISVRQSYLTLFRAVSAFVFLALGLPYRGAVTEALVVMAAGFVMVAPTRAMFAFGGVFKQRRKVAIPGPVLVLALLWLPLWAITMYSVGMRMNHAQQLTWACDGAITEVTRAQRNNSALALVVQSGDGHDRFEYVDRSLWERARPGQHLVKRPGSALALLDGESVRMVPTGMAWLNDSVR